MVLWVFGYGSLLWRAGFEYDDKLVGFVRGYKRVFHQGNTDHRGTPDYPGRTVTLEEDPDSVCWGIAFCVRGEEKKSIALSYLELREKEYDIRAYVDFYTDLHSTHPSVSGVLVYLASTDQKRNKYYLGRAPLKEMACQIAKAVGPSGSNADYLFELHKCLQKMGCKEEELDNLVMEVQKLLS
ncbi:hypothetical protein KP509_20G002000 [Ceratopteris richardii]|nr:hypothetical protein KP509_20G002000 [Ceratopteris richardii]